MNEITRGDRVVLPFYFYDGEGSLVDLSGASFESYMYGSDGLLDTFSNSQWAADPDQVANKGLARLTLSTTNTTELGLGLKEIVTKVTQSTYPFHYRGQILVKSPLPSS